MMLAPAMRTPDDPDPMNTTSLPQAAAGNTKAARTSGPSPRPSALHTWLREPLLHFLLLGALLFGIDHVVVSQKDDPRAIVAGRAVHDEARTLFKSSRGREPNAEELRALTQRWVDNEVLYREGMALRVEQGDAMIRERVIFKALMLVESGLQRPPIDDKVLRAWFEANRARYDDPARYDFQEAVLSGDTSEGAVRSFVQALNAGTPGDAKAGLRVFKARPLDNLVQSYGPDFARMLADAAPGEWRALPSSDGLRAVRLDAVSAAKPASFDALRNVIVADWTDATMAQLRTDAVRQRAKKYAIRFDGTAP